MRNLTATLCLTLVVLLFSPTVGWSADFQKGLDAYNKKDYATVLREWKPLAEQGHGRAQNGLATLYLMGLGVPKDLKTALKWFRISAQNGEVRAQFNLGYHYFHGRGVPQDDKLALKWFSLAAAQGHSKAQEFASSLKLENEFENQQPSATETTEKTPTPSSGDYQKGMDAYERGDFATARRIFEPLADHGHARAQYNLGVIYETGKGGTPRNYKTALKWYRLAAEQGDADAQTALGLKYVTGKGVLVSKNYETALKWFRLAAEQGYADAQTYLGMMYAEGLGVSQNYKTALKWFRLAGEQGHANAQNHLRELEKHQKKIDEETFAAHEKERIAREIREKIKSFSDPSSKKVTYRGNTFRPNENYDSADGPALLILGVDKHGNFTGVGTFTYTSEYHQAKGPYTGSVSFKLCQGVPPPPRRGDDRGWSKLVQGRFLIPNSPRRNEEFLLGVGFLKEMEHECQRVKNGGSNSKIEILSGKVFHPIATTVGFTVASESYWENRKTAEERKRQEAKKPAAIRAKTVDTISNLYINYQMLDEVCINIGVLTKNDVEAYQSTLNKGIKLLLDTPETENLNKEEIKDEGWELAADKLSKNVDWQQTKMMLGIAEGLQISNSKRREMRPDCLEMLNGQHYTMNVMVGLMIKESNKNKPKEKKKRTF